MENTGTHKNSIEYMQNFNNYNRKIEISLKKEENQKYTSTSDVLTINLLLSSKKTIETIETTNNTALEELKLNLESLNKEPSNQDTLFLMLDIKDRYSGYLSKKNIKQLEESYINNMNNNNVNYPSGNKIFKCFLNKKVEVILEGSVKNKIINNKVFDEKEIQFFEKDTLEFCKFAEVIITLMKLNYEVTLGNETFKSEDFFRPITKCENQQMIQTAQKVQTVIFFPELYINIYINESALLYSMLGKICSFEKVLINNGATLKVTIEENNQIKEPAIINQINQSENNEEEYKSE